MRRSITVFDRRTNDIVDRIATRSQKVRDFKRFYDTCTRMSFFSRKYVMTDEYLVVEKTEQKYIATVNQTIGVVS